MATKYTYSQWSPLPKVLCPFCTWVAVEHRSLLLEDGSLTFEYKCKHCKEEWDDSY